MTQRAIARGMRPNRHTLDEDSACRLLQGLVHPDDAPPGYGAVAGLLATAAQSPRAAVDEDIAAATVSAMVEAIRDGASVPQTQRRKSMLSKLLAGKALAAIGVVALTASGAAAATGSLPDPVQSTVAGAASHVGVDIPNPNHGNSAGHRQDGAHRPASDDTTSSTVGSDDSSGSDNGQGQEVSDTAHQAKQDGKPVGPTVCAVASDGKCQAGQHGKGSGSGEDHATTPTTGSIQTGEDHSDDHATTPTTGSIQTGEDHSQDHSGHGPGDSADH